MYPGYLLTVQGLHGIQMLKYRNVKRNAKNFSPQNLPKRERISHIKEMGGLAVNVGWILVVLRDDCRATLPYSSALADKTHTEGYG